VQRGYKTRRLVQENTMQEGLGRLTKSVTFDLKTLEALKGEKGGNEGKVFNLVRGLQKELDDNPNAAPILQPADTMYSAPARAWSQTLS
jgi:type I restriction enzyme, R subunit